MSARTKKTRTVLRTALALAALAMAPATLQATAQPASAVQISSDDPAHHQWWFAHIPDQTYGATLAALPNSDRSPDDGTRLSAAPSNVCKVTGSSQGWAWMRMVGVGTCTVTATSTVPATDGSVAPPVQHSFTVTPAHLIIQAENKEIASGDPMPTFTAAYWGLQNGDLPSAIQGVVLSGATESGPGRSTIFVRGGTSPNYTIFRANGTLTVDPVVTLKAAGLPANLHTWVRFDGARYATPAKVVVTLGSTHTVEWDQVLYDYNKGEYYATTETKYFLGTQGDDTETAHYATIPDLLMAGAIDDDADLLVDVWEQEIKPQVDQRGSQPALHRMARLVRASVGHTLSSDGADEVIAHLQVLYSSWGGQGTV